MPRRSRDVDPISPLLPRLRARARRVCRCPSEADDLVQECALKLWRRMARGERIEDVEAYAMTLLRHTRISRWRGRAEMDVLEVEVEDLTCAPGGLDRVMVSEVVAAIERLPEAQMRVLRCVVAGETRPAEIAECLGVPVGTVMSRLARGRAGAEWPNS